jgi:hypothetical protein
MIRLLLIRPLVAALILAALVVLVLTWRGAL